MFTKNIKQKLIILGIIILVAFLVALFVYLSQKKVTTLAPPTITSSVPSEGATGVNVFDSLTFTFDQPVDSTSLRFTSEPSENWKVSQKTPNSVDLDHEEYLRVATKYKITILQNGSLVGILNFETAHDQNDPRQLQNLQSEITKNYPLASFTPYETTKYRVVYSAPLTLEVDLKISMNSQDVINEVKSWVKSYGVDPDTHKYIVVSPSPTP